MSLLFLMAIYFGYSVAETAKCLFDDRLFLALCREIRCDDISVM